MAMDKKPQTRTYRDSQGEVVTVLHPPRKADQKRTDKRGEVRNG